MSYLTTLISKYREYCSLQNVPNVNKPKANQIVQGAVAGVVETTALYWTATWSIYRNANLPLPKGVVPYYRGYPLQLAGMVPMLTVMNCVYARLGMVLTSKNKQEPSLADSTLAAGLSGMASAIVNPIECVQVQRLVQQKELAAKGNLKPLNAKEVAIETYKRGGRRAFWVGTPLAACRNAVWWEGVRVFTPEASKKLDVILPEDCHPTIKKVIKLTVSGGIGALTALVSQPFHTVLTLMRTDPQKKKYVTAWCTAQLVYTGKVYVAKNGMPVKGGAAFLTGTAPRFVRITAGTPLVALFFNWWEKK